MILLIDNYDSFTYNLYQAFAVINVEVLVVRNDAITIDEIKQLNPLGIVLSPGPGHPKDAGICLAVIKQLGVMYPILGVCLGHQAIGMAYDSKVSRTSKPMHGKDSLVYHNQEGIFKNINLPCKVGRYHSLIVDKDSLGDELKIDATDSDGNIMALSHRWLPIYGVQFHPESILTPDGVQMLINFVEICNKNKHG